MIVGNGRPNGNFTPCDQCLLRKRPSLREFNPEELAFVKAFKTDELRVDAGASFLREGTRSEYLYTVLSGWAFRYKMLDDGRRQILNYALPADMLGLQGALMNEMEHSVEALTPLVLCVFPRAKLWDLYSRLPTLAFDITWLAAREEQLIDQHLADTLGMSLVHTNKTLKRLFISKAVRWKDRVFEMIDRSALATIAGSDPAKARPRPFI